MELDDNPFDAILNKVIQLLNNLHSKKLILKWQHKAMTLDPKTTELAHLYFNPKTHTIEWNSLSFTVNRVWSAPLKFIFLS